MRDQTYNGWTNYETWCVNLHLSNEQASQLEWEEEARACLEVAREDLDSVSDVPVTDEQVRDHAINALRHMLKDEFTGDQCPELPGFYGDLLRAAVSEVNWHEIARHYIDAVLEEESHA